MLIGQEERRPPRLVGEAADFLLRPRLRLPRLPDCDGSDCPAARSQLPSWAPTRSAAGAKASRFGANSADSETDWYAAAHSSAKNSTKVGVERMEDGDNRHQQPLQTSDPLAYIDDFNLEPLQLNSQVFHLEIIFQN